MTIYIIFLILIILSFYFYIYFHRNNKSNDIDDFLSDLSSETIYNKSPVKWNKKEYSNSCLNHYILNGNKKNIIIIESNLITQKLCLDYLKDKYNIYFFNTFEDFLIFYKSNKVNISIIMGTDKANDINIYNIKELLIKKDIFKGVKFILLTDNNNFYLGNLDDAIIKPVHKTILLLTIERNI